MSYEFIRLGQISIFQILVVERWNQIQQSIFHDDLLTFSNCSMQCVWTTILQAAHLRLDIGFCCNKGNIIFIPSTRSV